MLGLRRDGGLARSLRLLTLCFYGTALIVSVGIYDVIVRAAAVAGPPVWRSFVLAAVPVVLTGLSYAELTATWPDAGAEYTWVRHAFPRARLLRFALGVALLCAGLAAAAVVAAQFGHYLSLLTAIPAWIGAVVLVVACSLLNATGLKWTTPVVVALTMVEVLGLLAVVFLGTSAPGFGRALLAAPTPGIVAGGSIAFVAFLGFEDLANLAEETRSPARNLPAAILVCLAASTFLYVLLSLAVVALVDPTTLGAGDTLLTVVGRVSPVMADVLGGVVLFGAANTVLVALLAASRMAMGMARGHDLPPVLARVHPQRRVPVPAVLAVGGTALVLVPFGGTHAAASLGALGAVIGYVAVNVAVVVLRLRDPRRRRPFRVPGTVGKVPVLPIAGAVSALALVTQFPAPVLVAAATALAMAAVAWLARALTRRVA